jgi:hypothetical protein
MQFKNPEILYFLFALIIPILVHLFQLQKFKKVTFTNVAFLKKIALQTRQSSKLKKWLILATRMLLFSCLIFAFSQPYFSDQKEHQKAHNYIYLDNSISLNSSGKKGTLLPVAIQEIVENIPEGDTYSLVTNTGFYKNLEADDFKNVLKKVTFTTKSSNLNEVLLKINSQIKNKTKTLNNILLISDYQYNTENKNQKFTNVTTPISLLKLAIEQKNNISIDSIFISNKSETNFTLNVVIENQGMQKNNVPISIFNKEELLSKRSFSIERDATKIIDFEIQNQPQFLGEIKIQNNDVFSYDNAFFFSINYNEKINVLSIGKKSGFLTNIFTQKEFDFSQVDPSKINYNSIPKQQLIILNEITLITPSIANSIREFVNNGGSLILIPSATANLPSYNSFLQSMNMGTISRNVRDSLKITTIHYDHPLFKNVFTKKIQNFQYPSAIKSYTSTAKLTPILSFENGASFLSTTKKGNGHVYSFSAPINRENSNFTNSPLIVPTLYNIGQSSLQLSKLYYTLQQKNTIELNTTIDKDHVVRIQNNDLSFIPLQQNSQNKISITTTENPAKKGFYYIVAKDTLQTISYNNPKSESSLSYMDIDQLAEQNESLSVTNSIPDYFNELKQKNEVQSLWKLFLALAIVSLLLEILILKFFRT